jgi:Zn-dependent M16 (insulinase) family peptidase
MHHLYQNRPYAVQKLDEEDGQHMLSITWLLNDSSIAPKLKLSLYVLDYMLVGTSSSPLVKRLRESGLGSSVIGGGLSTGLLQNTFAIGMKGVQGTNIEKLEQLVFDILQDVVSDGFSEDEIEAAVNSISFQVRTIVCQICSSILSCGTVATISSHLINCYLFSPCAILHIYSFVKYTPAPPLQG